MEELICLIPVRDLKDANSNPRLLLRTPNQNDLAIGKRLLQVGKMLTNNLPFRFSSVIWREIWTKWADKVDELRHGFHFEQSRILRRPQC